MRLLLHCMIFAYRIATLLGRPGMHIWRHPLYISHRENSVAGDYKMHVGMTSYAQKRM